MLYKAVFDSSPVAVRARDNSKTDPCLGRLDSGIELDLGIQSPPNKFCMPDDFLRVQKGDVFRRVEVPREKRLIYVEKVPRQVASTHDDSSNCDAVFCLDIEAGSGEAMVTKGYIPAGCLEIEGTVHEEISVSCGTCVDFEGRLEEIQQLQDVTRKVLIAVANDINLC